MFLNMRLLLQCFFCLILVGCASSGTGLNIFSYDEEAQQGQQFATQVNHEYKIMHDAKLDAYIQRLGQKMITKGLEDPHFQYTFNVVDSSEVNAFAIPGGHLYVNLALLKEAESESEIVGVVGHEIGHVVHRHGTKRMTDATLLQALAKGTAAVVGEGGGQYAGLGVLLFGQAGLLKYGRNAELEADHTGVDILYRTNYDVHALSGFFQKLLKIEQQRGAKAGGLTQLLATHPPTAERIHLAEEYISTLPAQKNPQTNSPEFEEIRKYIAPMTPTKPAPPKGNG
jgi:predicted Zn-dependent protease